LRVVRASRIVSTRPIQSFQLQPFLSKFNFEHFLHLGHDLLITITKGKNPKIVPQQWTHNLMQPTLLNVMKIPHFGRNREVNACIRLLFSCYHGGYLWLDRQITVNLILINQITGLSMQGPDLQEFYPGKIADRTLAQRIKDTYGDLEKGMQGYKVASIENASVRFGFYLIIGKLVHNNRFTQVTGFVVDLAGKCIEGLQINWEKYFINQLELYYIQA
jgi:hypothetical protein